VIENMKLNVDYVHTLPILIECENCKYKQVWFEYSFEAFKGLKSLADRKKLTCWNCKIGTMKVLMLKRDVAEKLKDKFPNEIAPEFYEEIEELLKSD
jgi:hypothetical protein